MDIIKEEYNLKVVTEVTEIQFLDRVCETADILQISSSSAGSSRIFMDGPNNRIDIFDSSSSNPRVRIGNLA